MTTDRSVKIAPTSSTRGSEGSSTAVMGILHDNDSKQKGKNAEEPREDSETCLSGTEELSTHAKDDNNDDVDDGDDEVEDEEDFESDYEYEDDEWEVSVEETERSMSSSVGTSNVEAASKQKYHEEVVKWSLRAGKEATGGKRRLAQDLAKVMMSDTSKSGFSMEPTMEDSMDKWRIKLYQFDPEAPLHQDMVVLGISKIELEMSFPDQYPFAPPFVRVVRPKFQRQTGHVMNGALCMELLTNEGWNPVNDIESVIVSIRAALVVGGGRLAAAMAVAPEKRKELLQQSSRKVKAVKSEEEEEENMKRAGFYTESEAIHSLQHLSAYHEKNGWMAAHKG